MIRQRPQAADSPVAFALPGCLAVPRAAYGLTRAALLGPGDATRVEPFDVRRWPHFEVVSLELADPFDSAVVATARALAVGGPDLRHTGAAACWTLTAVGAGGASP